MADVSGDQFGKPYFTKGGQGKFFHDPKPTDEHRYPRGYTPERMDQVHGAMIHVQQVPGGGRAFGGPGGNRRVRETLARSTMPMEPLSRAQMAGKGITHPLAIMTQAHQIEDFAHGLYSPGAKHEGGMIAIAPNSGEEKAGQTLLHEAGHFVSHKIENNLHARYAAQLPEEKGREEARADDHRVEHWRPDPRDVKAGRSQPPTSVYETLGRATEFGKAYHEARRTPLVSEQQHAAGKVDPMNTPKQGTLL